MTWKQEIPDQNDRYARQIRFRMIGKTGQKKLEQKRVLIVGMGALGSAVADHLVRAGVGSLRIIDRDYVEWSNLQRQTLYDEADAREALPKAIAAQRKLRNINADVHIEPVVADFTASNASSYVQSIDLVLDGTDNFATRFLLNDLCFYKQIPYIYGGIIGSRAMCASFIPGQTLCLRCLISPQQEEAETCETEGVLSSTAGITAAIQAAEALKYLIDATDALKRSITYIDLWHNKYKETAFGKPSPHCPVCSRKEYPALFTSQKTVQAVRMCGRNTVQLQHPCAFDLDQLTDRLQMKAPVYRNPFLLKVFMDDVHTLVLFADGRVLIQGTEDVTFAQRLYTRFIVPATNFK